MYQLRYVYKDEKGAGVTSVPVEDVGEYPDPPDFLSIYLFEEDGTQQAVIDFKTEELKLAEAAKKWFNSRQHLCDVAAIAAIMSDEVGKKLYKVMGQGYIAMVHEIADWATEFAHKFIRLTISPYGWEELMEDPTKFGFSKDTMCWDDAVMEFAKQKLDTYNHLGEFDNGDNDQPITCPRCGARTNFTDTEENVQHHVCIQCNCDFTLYVNPEEEYMTGN